MSFPMSDILPVIRDLAANELADLGDSETDQNNVIIRFVNVSLQKRARQAYNVEFSDILNIAADGDQTFLLNTQPITDMYEPLAIYKGTKAGSSTTKRTSYDAPLGWIRDSENQPFNTKGLTGNYVLKYIRYPATVSASTDTVEMPLAGKWDLIMDVVRLCKYPKNFYNEAEAIGKLATGTATVKASIAAKGTNSAPPSLNDREE